MKWRIGRDVLDNNSTSFTRSFAFEFDPQGRGLKIVWDYTVRVRFASAQLNAVSRQLDFSAQENRLRSLLSVDPQSFAFLADDGSITDNVLVPLSNSDFGPKCIGSRSPIDGQGEYSGTRTMDFQIRASYMLARPGTILDFGQTFQVSGGGPDFLIQYGRFGVPVRQPARVRTPCTIVQQGFAIGHLSYPRLGGPEGGAPLIWSQYIQGSPHTSGFETPRGTGRIRNEYRIDWSYTYLLPQRPLIDKDRLTEGWI
jgi:hypothetical protein